MNLPKDGWKDFVQRWNGWSAKLKYSLAIVAVGVGLAVVVWNSYVASKTTLLFNGYRFTEAEMQRIELALSSANLKEFSWDSGRLRIPTRTWDSYLKAIADADVVPKGLGEHEANLSKSFNPFLTSDRLKDQRLNARSRDIAAALQSLPYVEFAYIMYDEKPSGFAGVGQKSAVVWIKPANFPNLSIEQVRSIAKQVQASFAGLAFEDVTVVDVGTGMTHRPSEMESSPFHEKLYAIKVREEASLQSKLERALSKFGQVRVEVQLEFDPTTRKEISKVQYEDVDIEDTASDSATQGQGIAPRSGQAEIVRPKAKGTYRVTTPDRTELHENIRGHELTRLEQGMMRVIAASATIAIPSSFYRAQTMQAAGNSIGQDPVASSGTLESSPHLAAIRSEVQREVESIARNLMPQTASAACSIIVTDFDDLPTVAPVSWIDSMQRTLRSPSSLLSVMCLIAIAVVVVRFILRKPLTDAKPRSSVETLTSLSPPPVDPTLDPEWSGRIHELNELLKQRPEDSVERIKQWLKAA